MGKLGGADGSDRLVGATAAAELSNMTKLKEMSLHNCQLGADGVDKAAELSNLGHLGHLRDRQQHYW